MRRAALGVVLLVLWTANTAAQRPAAGKHRSGFWIESVAGIGNARVACSDCTEVVSLWGFANNFRIGGTISDHVLIGFEGFDLLDRAFGFSPSDPTTRADTWTSALVIIWYPGRRGLFFKGGVGSATGQFSIPSGAGQADTSTGRGIGLTFGAGWDWPISRRFALTGNVGTYIAAIGDVVLPSRRVDDVIATMYALGIGVTFR